MKRSLALSACLALCMLGGPAFGLDVGDKAPALSIAEWVQGDAIDLKKDMGKKVYMVEFWATWCPPCKMSVPILNEMQKKYAKDLTIIGVTSPDDRGNSVPAVKKFVKDRGAEMTYHVAVDKDDATTRAYLASTGVMGIPYAYLVGKEGTVVWHGSPLDPALDEVVGKVASGSYDVSAAKKQAELDAEVSKRFEALNEPASQQKWSVVWDGLVGIMKLDPANIDAMDVLTQIYVNEMRDKKAYRDVMAAHIAAHKSDARVMQRLAGVLASNEDYSTRVPELTLEAAKAAYEADKKDPANGNAYAIALYQVGALDQAIVIQEEVVSASTNEEQIKMARDVLAYYKQCKEIQTGLK